MTQTEAALLDIIVDMMLVLTVVANNVTVSDDGRAAIAGLLGSAADKLTDLRQERT